MSESNSAWQRIRLFLRNSFKSLELGNFENQDKIDQEYIRKVRGGQKIPQLKQLKYLAKFYSQREILVTKISISLILISIITLGVNFYFNNLETIPKAGGEYREAVIGAPTYINPLFSQTNDVDQDLTNLIFSSLIKTDNHGQLIPDLAEDYSIDEEHTTYTFKIKPNVFWHDGIPLNADDIVFTVESIKNPNFKSPLYTTFRSVSVAKVDDLTVRFQITEPFAPFLSVFTFGILPAHLWQEIEASYAILSPLNLKPIGSGPYQFDALVKDKKGTVKEYRLKRFDNHYQEGPFIEKISIKFFENFIEANQSLASGNVDGFGFLPRNIASSNDFGESKSKQAYTLNLPQYSALFFNQESNPVLEDKDVRLSLSLATSRQQVIEAAFPNANANPVNAPILPNFVGYDPTLPVILFDQARAAKILDDAGWDRVAISEQENTDEENAIKATETADNLNLGLTQSVEPTYNRQKTLTIDDEERDVLLEVTITTIQRDENVKVAEKIKELWEAIGIKVNLKIVETINIQKDIIQPRAYEILLFGQILGKDPDPYPFWHSSQANYPGLNLSLYSNNEVDKLLESGRQTADETIRQKNYFDFQKILGEDIPAIFLYSLNYTYILPSSIQGIDVDTIHQTSDRFSDINNWYIKTRKKIKLDL